MSLETLVSTPSTIAQARAIISSVPDMCYTLIKIMADLNLLDSEVTTVCEHRDFGFQWPLMPRRFPNQRILAGGNQPLSTGPSPVYSTPPVSRASGYQNQIPTPVLATSVDPRPPILTPQVSTPPVIPADPTAILAALPPEQRASISIYLSISLCLMSSVLCYRMLLWQLSQ